MATSVGRENDGREDVGVSLGDEKVKDFVFCDGRVPYHFDSFDFSQMDYALLGEEITKLSYLTKCQFRHCHAVDCCPNRPQKWYRIISSSFPHVLEIAGMLMTFQSWRSSAWLGWNFGKWYTTSVLLCRSAVRPIQFGKLTTKERKKN